MKKKKPNKTAKVPVSDDWLPNLDGDLVRVTFHKDEQRISVWGDDDFGMEKFDTNQEEYDFLIKQTLSKDFLKKRKFIQA